MSHAYPLSLHLFRRDLRLEDNTALIEALKQSEAVLPCFIFDTRQVDKNKYKSNNAITFMGNSLKELDAALRAKGGQLYLFHGIAEEVIEALLKAHPIKAVYLNRDYTPFSKKRDEQIKKACAAHHVDFYSYADALLHEPEEVLKSDGKPYTVFTPSLRKALTLSVDSPVKNKYHHYYAKSVKIADTKTLDALLHNPNSALFVKGGRKEGIALLKKLTSLTQYQRLRDYPEKEMTSRLSAHLKFGTVSVREAHAMITQCLGKHHPLINQLHWRDFFTHIGYHFPYVFGHAFHQKYDALTWSTNEAHFKAWCEGKTGFPIVDAGMRELNETGYMHNRVRMIVASFLTKDLHIDWRRGEQYFATQLVDYDPALNNGNWQWSASTGCDAQPYFRIFNPWLQQAKFDPDCVYIKRWVPELKSITNKIIHQRKDHFIANYPMPLVDHAIESAKAKLAYKNA